jgi:hypothetical protein
VERLSTHRLNGHRRIDDRADRRRLGDARSLGEIDRVVSAPLRATMAFTFSDNGIPHDTSWAYVAHEYGPFLRYMLQVDFPFRTHILATVALTALIVLLATTPPPNSSLTRIRRILLAVSAAALVVLVLLIAPLQLASIPDPLPAGLLLVVSLLPLFAPAHDDDFVLLVRCGGIAAVAYLFLLPQATDLRLALVILPFAAIGFVRGISWAIPDPAEGA